MERVSVINATKLNNLLIVAPHGADDTYTETIAEDIANQVGCHAVINRGFKKSNHVDSLKDQADCNDIDHINKDFVVFEEFLEPILNIYTNQENDYNDLGLNIIHIHGMGDNKPPFILGMGLSQKGNDSITCEAFFAEQILANLRQYPAAIGVKKFAARRKNNLTQYFRHHYNPIIKVNSIQIEICTALRSDLIQAKDTANMLSRMVHKMNLNPSYGELCQTNIDKLKKQFQLI